MVGGWMMLVLSGCAALFEPPPPELPLQERCDQFDGPACFEYGKRLFDEGRSDEAVRALTRACGLGNRHTDWKVGACLELGDRQFEGRGLPRDVQAAMLTYMDGSGHQTPLKQLAAAKEGRARLVLAKSSLDLEGARRGLDIGCERGNIGWACTDLGITYADGELEPPDFAKALPLFLRGCDLNWAQGCVNAARVMGEGLAGPVDAASALRLRQRACEMGHPEACDQ